MPTRTFQKTTPTTMSTTKATSAEVGSDEYMVQRGYHPASKVERHQYGKFVNREGFFSIARGMVRRWAKGPHATAEVRVFASRTEGSTFPLDRRLTGQ